MNILITNDDGIQARGMQELIRSLHEEAGATIYVCAPDGQRSATGHGITMNKPIDVTEIELENVEQAFQTTGLPADCVKVGIAFLRQEGIPIDMVYSGINHGGNLGTDTLYSGTVAAALEGSLCGIPSVSVSVDSHQAEYFEYACELAVNAARVIGTQIDEGTADCSMVLNINTPNCPRSEIKGVRYTRLGPREYNEVFVPADMDSEEMRLKRDAARKSARDLARESERESARAAADRAAAAIPEEEAEALKYDKVELPGTFRYSGTPVIYPDLPEDLDVVSHQNGYATITPIHTDLTFYHKIEEIKTWGLV